MPQSARWETLRNQAKQPEICRILDEALVAIEDHHSPLKNILDKRFARTQIEPSRLGQLIDLILNVGFTSEDKTRDVLEISHLRTRIQRVAISGNESRFKLSDDYLPRLNPGPRMGSTENVEWVFPAPRGLPILCHEAMAFGVGRHSCLHIIRAYAFSAYRCEKNRLHSVQSPAAWTRWVFSIQSITDWRDIS